MLNEKQCSKCKQLKTLDMFYRNKAHKDGLQNQCIACIRANYVDKNEIFRARGREYYAANAEARRAYRNAYYQRNLESVKAAYRAYRQKNLEKMRAYSRNYYIENIETFRQKSSIYRQVNREFIRCLNHRRNAQIKANGGSFTQYEIAELKEKQGWRCAYCQRDNVLLSIDHIIPIFQGGINSIENICMACRNCNSSKGPRTPAQWVNRWYLRKQRRI